MITAIQNAYYLHARNPSDTQVLIDLATEIGCDSMQFAHYLHSEAAREALDQQRALAQQLGVQGFPALVYKNSHGKLIPVLVDYVQPHTMLERIEQANVA